MAGRIEAIASTRVISLKELRRRYPSEAACRGFFEKLRWPGGPRCPRCAHGVFWRLEGQKCRPGLRQCQQCRYQYTVTTGTPMHSSKLEFWTWIQALYFVVTSSKGISSVVLARNLGVTQATAWRLGHSIREMMHDRDGKGPLLKNDVEMDIKYLGGAPKQRKNGLKNPRGKGTSKAKILITAERGGAVKGTVIPSETADDIQAVTDGIIEPGSWIFSDKQNSFLKALRGLAGLHETVNHSAGEYVRDGVHSGTADGFGSLLERAKFGVWHKFGKNHVQRYVDEMAFRWSNRIREKVKSKSGRQRLVTKLAPIDFQFAALITAGLGRRMRRTKNYGFQAFSSPAPVLA